MRLPTLEASWHPPSSDQRWYNLERSLLISKEAAAYQRLKVGHNNVCKLSVRIGKAQSLRAELSPVVQASLRPDPSALDRSKHVGE